MLKLIFLQFKQDLLELLLGVIYYQDHQEVLQPLTVRPHPVMLLYLMKFSHHANLSYSSGL